MIVKGLEPLETLHADIQRRRRGEPEMISVELHQLMLRYRLGCGLELRLRLRHRLSNKTYFLSGRLRLNLERSGPSSSMIQYL